VGSRDVAVAVDLVVLTLRPVDEGRRLCAVVIERGIPPFEGQDALPGGFVLLDEDLAAAAARELQEESGLTAPPVHLEQLASYGEPGRDPRRRVVSVAYLALAPDLATPTAGSDAAQARWLPVDHLGGLAFDHDRILADGVERARAKLEYTPLGAAFCPPEFTVAQLREVYETVWGAALDPRNFHRKITGVEGLLVPTGRTARDGGRPAQLYRRGPATALHPPMLRPR